MNVKLKDIHPNPYKYRIGNGKLNQEQVERLKASISELGHMGNIPCVKIKSKIYQVSHHHRLEALRQLYGEDCDVGIELKDYSDEQLFRGMVNENLTQRMGDFREETDNCLAISEFLIENKILFDNNKEETAVLSQDSHLSDGRNKPEQNKPQYGSVRQVERWINKFCQEDSLILSFQRISDLIRLKVNLPQDLYDEVILTHKGPLSRRGEVLSKTQGLYLATPEFDDDEKRDLAKVLKCSREARVRKQSSLLAVYKKAPEFIKEDVRKQRIDLADIEDEIDRQKLKMISEDRTQWVFMPNFEERLRGFNFDVCELEEQVNRFSDVFNSSDFGIRYQKLNSKQKKDLDNMIGDICERIKKCYDEVKEFSEQISKENLLNEKKEGN